VRSRGIYLEEVEPAQILITTGVSLRSKRFRRAFRPLEAFFAFWLRKNWGERNTDALFCARPNFPAAKKAKSASNVRKTLATQAKSALLLQVSLCAYKLYN